MLKYENSQTVNTLDEVGVTDDAVAGEEHAEGDASKKREKHSGTRGARPSHERRREAAAKAAPSVMHKPATAIGSSATADALLFAAGGNV